jgi:predicted ABC-type ATPase
VIDWSWLDLRPCVVAIAGPNGAGKTTFYEAHISPAGLPFINADRLAKGLDVDAYQAAEIAGSIRQNLLRRNESFVFETVFSDPVGDKVQFLKDAQSSGFSVTLCFIGIEAHLSEERVAMRVTQGGHDVATEKLRARFPRTMANLEAACGVLSRLLVFDNSNLADPYRLIAVYENGNQKFRIKRLPTWFTKAMN